jgi:putative hemin transport protein
VLNIPDVASRRLCLPDGGGMSAQAVPGLDSTGIDLPALRAGWASLRDEQGLFRLLHAHGLTRLCAVRLAAPQFAQRVDRCAARVLLEGAALRGMTLQLCVGGQMHWGAVDRVSPAGNWLRIVGSSFSISLREDAIAEAWAVRRPSVDGLVGALELYGGDGELMARFQSDCAPGQPERCAWRQLLDTLVDDPAWNIEPVGCAA